MVHNVPCCVTAVITLAPAVPLGELPVPALGTELQLTEPLGGWSLESVWKIKLSENTS